MPLTTFRQQHHVEDDAPDTTPREYLLNPVSFRIDVFIFNNDALVSWSHDGQFWTTERRFVAGSISSIDVQVKRFRVRNRTVGQVAHFELTGYFDPVELIGIPPVYVPG